MLIAPADHSTEPHPEERPAAHIRHIPIPQPRKLITPIARLANYSSLAIANPSKLALPAVAKVTTSETAPAIRGEQNPSLVIGLKSVSVGRCRSAAQAKPNRAVHVGNRRSLGRKDVVGLVVSLWLSTLNTAGAARLRLTRAISVRNTAGTRIADRTWRATGIARDSLANISSALDHSRRSSPRGSLRPERFRGSRRRHPSVPAQSRPGIRTRPLITAAGQRGLAYDRDRRPVVGSRELRWAEKV